MINRVFASDVTKKKQGIRKEEKTLGVGEATMR